MIPDLLSDVVENNGEKLFYEAARELPDTYTVLYSYKYRLGDESSYKIKEVDFVIVHPSLGFVVVEVKQGEISYYDNQWHELKNSGLTQLHKDPVDQARTAMFNILGAYKKETGKNDFPLGIHYAICFPECAKISGILPNTLKTESVWTFSDLEVLEEKIHVLAGRERKAEPAVVDILINKVLAPRFKIFASLEDQISMFNSQAHKVLTEEQERILDETEEDSRKIYLGGAGTGKTFIAMEKARRLDKEGKKVFLTCFNKALVEVYSEQNYKKQITSLNFHDYLLETLREQGQGVAEPANPAELDTFYNLTLPELAFDYFSSLPEEEKFDAVIVDEGQDFQPGWLVCLESMLKEGGQFYIFADPQQDIFGCGIDALENFEMSRHRLTINLRNTEKINEWITPLGGGKKSKARLKGGLPVISIPWKDESEERRLIEKEAGRLVSQGISPARITILSPHILAKSSLNGLDKIKEWKLVDMKNGPGHGIKFNTIRAFKGLEADIVFLIGVKAGSKVCTRADIYVGASRAKFLLYVFHQEGWQACVE